jgi:hypothetical protein
VELGQNSPDYPEPNQIPQFWFFDPRKKKIEARNDEKEGNIQIPAKESEKEN